MAFSKSSRLRRPLGRSPLTGGGTTFRVVVTHELADTNSIKVADEARLCHPPPRRVLRT